jgi:hypothetical protein
VTSEFHLAKLSVKPSRCRHAHVSEREVQLILIPDIGITWGEWPGSHAGCSLPQGKGPPVPIWAGGWMGLRATLDTEAKENIFVSVGDPSLVIQSVDRHYTA